MYKETITYVDFDGNERTEDVFFNLTKAELVKMELMESGTLTQLLDRIIKAKETPEIISEVDRLIMASYGVKSPDGKYFDKSESVKEKFKSSELYSNIFMKLISDDEAAAKFVNGIMPKEILDSATAQIAGDAVPTLVPNA